MHASSISSISLKRIALLATSVLALAPLAVPLRGFAAESGNKPADSFSRKQLSASGQTVSMTPMPLVAPLFVANHEFTSTLILVNGTALDTYADVVLRGMDGTKIVQQRVAFLPNSQQQLDVGTLLASALSPATTGSILVMPSPDLKGAGIAAALSIIYVGSRHTNYTAEELTMPSVIGSQTLRAVAEPGEGALLLAVTSLVETAQHLRVNCFDSSQGSFSRSIGLRPAQTLLTEPCKVEEQDESFANPLNSVEDNARGAAGISLTSDAAPGSYAAFAVVSHRSKEEKFFSTVAFTDPKTVASPHTVFTGVPVGFATLLPGANFTPEISLANFSSSVIHVKVQFARTGNGTSGVENVKNLVVTAGSAANLTLAGLQGDPGLQNSFIIGSDGAAGDLLAKVVSRGDSVPHLVELVGKDQMDPNNGGLHPWSLRDGGESTLLLFNHSQTSQYFNVMIAAGSIFWQKAYLLGSMQTKAISLREVIQDQTVDDTGRKLPKDSEIGQVSWVTPTPGNTKGKLLQSNSVLGMALTFNSVQGCVPCGQSYINSMPPVPVGTYSTASFLMPFCVAYLSCDGSPTGGFNFDPPWAISWQSSNQNVATVAPNGYSATVFGVSPGSSNLNATVTFPEPGLYPPYTCPKTASGSVGVSPNLTSISPAQGPTGNTVPVTLNGSGLSAATINAGSGITVAVTSRTNTQIQANFTISASAPAGNHAVSVAAGGQSSPTLNFFVQVPTSLTIVPGTDSTTAENTCTFSGSDGKQYTGCGIKRAFTYQIMDQQSPAQPISTGVLQFWDEIHTTSPNNLGLFGYSTTCAPSNTGPCGTTTSSDGKFLELNLGACSSVCFANNACTTGGPTNANQTWHIGSFTVTQAISYYCNHVTVNGL